MPLALGLGVSAAAGVASGAMQSSAAKGGAKAQTDAANNAAMLQYATAQQSNNLIQSIYGANTARLAPYVSTGLNAQGELANLTGTAPAGVEANGTPTSTGNPLTSPLTKNFAPTMEQLAQTPGYQFALHQGILATQAGSSAIGQGSAVAGTRSSQGSGVGASGPLGKGLANYAEGLAGTTYQQQFANNLAQNMQTYQMLAGVGNVGENAAAQTGTMGTAASGQGANALLSGASGYGSYSTAGAASTASGMVGSASALGNAATGVGNSALLYGALGGGAGGSGGTLASLGGISSSNPVM